MSTEWLVSVIIPTYNRCDVIKTAIDSVLGQTYRPIEVIVVDDGSTDGTAQILRSFGEQIRVVTQDNAGPAIARNRGIALARGEMVAFLDSDDSWLPSKLARQVELLERAGDSVPCCLCNCTVLYADGSKTSTFKIGDVTPRDASGVWLNPAEILISRFILFNQAVMIRREVLQRIGYFDESLRFGEDYELPMRLSLEGPWIILRDELVLYNAAGPGSWSEKALREKIRLHEDLIQVRRQMLLRVENSPLHARLRGRARAELHREERALRIAQLSSRNAPLDRAVANLLRFWERLKRSAFRRGPTYPRVLVRGI